MEGAVVTTATFNTDGTEKAATTLLQGLLPTTTAKGVEV